MITNHTLNILPLLGLLGTQEIILIIILIITVVLIYLVYRVYRFFKNLVRQNRRAASNSIAAEIDSLFVLKEKCAITQQEYDTRKSQLLHQ